MTSTLKPRERRLLDAYLELESPLSEAGSEDERERIVAAAFAPGAPVGAPVTAEGPVHRIASRGVLVGIGLGLCAAVLVGWWVGSTSMLEVSDLERPEQAPLFRDDRPVREAVLTTPEPRSSRRPSQGGAAAELAGGVPSTEELPEPTGAVAPQEPGGTVPVESAPDDEALTSADAELVPHRRGAVRPRAGARSTSPTSVAASEPPTSESPASVSPARPTLDPAEVTMLDQARRLARRGEHEAALEKLRAHARAYPGSLLATERAAEEVVVLCRMGAASAEVTRAQFLAGRPPQYLRARVGRACTP